MNDRNRWFESLPFYVNGSLSRADAAWMRDYVQRNPVLQAQVQLHEAMRDTLRTSVERAMENVPADLGWTHMQALLRADDTTQHSARPARRGMLEWLLATRTPTGWRLAPALALALCVIAVQTVWLVQKETATYSQIRSAGQAIADGPLLRVNFKPDAREADIRLLLIEARALIVAGPTRLGDYYLKPPSGRLQAVRSRLAGSHLVQQVDEVPGLPEEVLE